MNYIFITAKLTYPYTHRRDTRHRMASSLLILCVCVCVCFCFWKVPNQHWAQRSVRVVSYTECWGGLTFSEGSRTNYRSDNNL